MGIVVVIVIKAPTVVDRSAIYTVGKLERLGESTFGILAGIWVTSFEHS